MEPVSGYVHACLIVKEADGVVGLPGSVRVDQSLMYWTSVQHDLDKSDTRERLRLNMCSTTRRMLQEPAAKSSSLRQMEESRSARATSVAVS